MFAVMEPVNIIKEKHLYSVVIACCVNTVGRILDYVIEPVPIDLPLLHPSKTQITHVACGRAHTVIVTDTEGGRYIAVLCTTYLCQLSLPSLWGCKWGPALIGKAKAGIVPSICA